MKLNLEANFGTQVTMDHPLWEWLLERASTVLNSFRICNDGKTGFQRMRGKLCNKQVCCFGEKVLWMPLPMRGHEVPNMEPRMHEGVWLGLRTRSGEDII